jgi:hypothetical protein
MMEDYIEELLDSQREEYEDDWLADDFCEL